MSEEFNVGVAQEAGGDATTPDPIGPVTLERVRRVLDDGAVPWFVDRDGDLGILWRRGTLRLDVWNSGDVPALLLLSASWHRRPHLDRLPGLLSLSDEWNAQATGLKSFMRVLDDGHVLVCFEATLLVAAGATDAQIATFTHDTVALVFARATELDARFPDPLTTGGES